jgi:hypothetical protein
MNARIIDYALITVTSAGELCSNVSIAIANGWQPFGGVATGPGTISQALVKYQGMGKPESEHRVGPPRPTPNPTTPTRDRQ